MADVVLIALGSNVGDRMANLTAARTAVASLAGVRLLAASTVEETVPLGGRLQQPYLNQMVALRTGLDPFALLGALQRIERRLGRVRVVRWGARTIDLDIVRFGDRMLETERLSIPHAGLASREFWQREVAELERLVTSAA